MYQPSLSLRDRAAPLAAVVLLHAAIIYALLHLTSAGAELARQADIAVFDVFVPPPPPEPPPPPPPPEVARQSASPPKARPNDEGAAAPENIKSKATPLVVPPPRIVVPAPSPVVAATTPANGASATQGAGAVVGPGTGAGGVGNGSGSGGSGNGSGGGGGGGNGRGEARARLVTPGLTLRDFPPALYRRWPRGAAISIILRVGSDGVPLSCRIGRSFGDPVLDSETCRLAIERLRFEPGRDEHGRPVADFFGYTQQDYGRLGGR